MIFLAGFVLGALVAAIVASAIDDMGDEHQ